MKTILEEWLTKEKKKNKSSFKNKNQNYIHFDLKLSVDRAFYILQRPDLQKHAFYPFIRIEKERKSFEVQANGTKKLVSKTPRPLNYGAHLDSYIYSYYSYLLQSFYEKLLEKKELQSSVIAYRSVTNIDGKKMNNVYFADEIFSRIKTLDSCVVLTYDIKEFYESLDHEYLKKTWTKLLNLKTLPKMHYKIFRSLTDYYYIKRDLLYKELGIKENKDKSSSPHNKYRLCSEKIFRDVVCDKSRNLILRNPHIAELKGIPQGTPISGMLANLYLLEFDTKINQISKKSDCMYRRYSDDIIVVCPNESIAKKIHTLVITQIKKYKLETNSKKSKTFYFKKNINGILSSYNEQGCKAVFQYLGLEFDGEQAHIRSSSLSRYYQKMKSTIKKSMYYANSKNKQIPKRRLYQQVTYLGKQNFISYALKSATILTVNNNIKKQIAPHFKKVHKQIKKWKQT